MRIGLKLTAAFLVIASLVAAAGYLAQRTGRELERQMERLSHSAIRQMAEATNVALALYADQLAAHHEIMARRRGANGSSSGEASERPLEKAKNHIANLRAAVESRADGRVATELAELASPQTQPSLEPLQQAFDHRQELMQQFYDLLDKDVDAAERLFDEQVRPHFENELLPQLDALREQAGRESTRGIRRAERALDVADRQRGMLLVTAAAVAITIGLVMSRSIGKPLGTLQRAARDIGSGCLDTQVAIHSRDEIGMLATAINQMAAELREKTVSIREKELLLKEVHHRVKNNLQVISSLLSLQAQEIRDPEMIRVFEESQTRVRSMALIHEQLYRSDDLARIDFAAYVQELVDNLRQGFGGAAARVSFHLDVQPAPLLLDLAIPCGMIVNELVANALQHAFSEDRPGEIRIAFAQEGESYLITVADNGAGMREGLTDGEATSTGLKVVTALTRQIHGSLEHAHQDGTTFTIRFDKPEQQPRPEEES